MKRMLIYPALVLLMLAGCGGYQDREAGDSAVQMDQAPAGPAQNAPPRGAPEEGSPAGDTVGSSGIISPAERKIIRNGRIDLRVESVASTEGALARIAAAHNGYIANSARSRSSGNALTATAQIRFPSDKFEAVLAAVRALGETESESIGSSDVTQEYIDLSARLKTQQELEARLLKLLQDRGGRLADIIEIESKLAEVRNGIESTQGRLRYLQNQVAYSTLDISMTEPGALGTGSTETFGGKMQRAFSDGLDVLVEMIAGLITLLLGIIPLLALGIAAYFLVIRPWIRRRRERRTGPPSGPPAA